MSYFSTHLFQDKEINLNPTGVELVTWSFARMFSFPRKNLT